MTIKIEYFSDVLCVWAYGGQIRMDELTNVFSGDIEIEYRFVSIFGAGKQHVRNEWKDKGGFEGFNHHLQQLTGNWKHISISPDLWTNVLPESSTSAHLYLKAIQLCSIRGDLDDLSPAMQSGRSRSEEAIWAFRDAFFRHGRDISNRAVQDEIAEDLQLPLKNIREYIDTGQAHAALHQDDEAKNNYKIPGSPTLVLNEGRQLLYGNVGYRIIDANIQALLRNPDSGDASWC